MNRREAISVALRFRVLMRDKFTCRYCGAHPPYAKLVVDHAQSVADGGQSTEDNLVTACEPCNQGKGDRTVLPIAREKTLSEYVADTVFNELFQDYVEPMCFGEFRHAYGSDALNDLDPVEFYRESQEHAKWRVRRFIPAAK